ncbi:DNA recombination protein RmuC [Ramlibacter humi]|uniref:DNA recombination protein RmuC n=1 Tax=Ramlibacter humi TaxID=2530451 RepID=UPI001EEFAAFB|nr:DNA recombination protein RmuC [Ramlibacter humi]
MDSIWLAFLALLAGLGAGAALVAFAGRGRAAAQVDAAVARAEATLKEQLSESRERARQAEAALQAERAELAQLQSQTALLRDQLDAARDETAKLGERAAGLEPLRAQLQATESREAELRGRIGTLDVQAAELQARVEAERRAAQERLQELVAAREALSNQFKALANEILEEKSRRFAEQNRESLGQLLDPLRTQIAEFKGKVEEVYVNEGKDRSALSKQVEQLLALNQSLSQDAQNLTLALKGNNKAQGNWGELVLERVLEASGLRKGEEYVVQDYQVRDDGSRAQPDVVVHLPDERRLVIDSKVSLIAYEEYVLAETDTDRAAALKRHLDSTRGHMKDLSGKNYQALYGFKSLDFVLLFVPIEPAFMAAVSGDDKLFMDAWEKNVLLVSPSTLLFVVRTVAHLWRQEAQGRNAQEIAKRGAELYDRLSDFVKELQQVGTRIDQARDAYTDAFNKLSKNRGNVIRQAEMLKDLGVKPTKALPAAVVEAATSDEVAVIAPLAVRAAENTPQLGTTPPLL